MPAIFPLMIDIKLENQRKEHLGANELYSAKYA